MKLSHRGTLLATSLLTGAALFAAPAFAQTATGATDVPASTQTLPDAQQNAEAQADQGQQLPSTTGQTQGDIVVTGSILRTQGATPSPVTTITAENLDQRAINTVQDAIQQLSSNNGPGLTNSFTANGAFAGGASAVSLRGLSTNSTLVLFDGLRAAYYPLADDGSRNFVDLNTIPDDIVDRIEVLRDGASSSYGADAIAGVVNVITKRAFNGISGRAEAGISERGDGPNQRLTLTAGTGDLDAKGYNAYISGFYYHSGTVYNRQLDAPYNSDNKNGIGGPNDVFNGRNADGTYTGFALPYDFYVRPYTADGYANGVQNGGTALGRYQKLNPTSACYGGSSTTLSATELAQRNDDGTLTFGSAVPSTPICQQDVVADYQVVQPNIQRFGGSARFTGNVGGNVEAYAEVNFQQSSTDYTGFPPVLRNNAPTGVLYPQFSTSTPQAANNAVGSGVLALPIYVCPERLNCAFSANRQLNPNNPFAAQGQIARITGRIPTFTESQTRSRVYRAAVGVSGTVFNDVDFKVDATAMHNDLRRTQNGYVYIQHLLDVIADGSYNFVNPGANTQATLNYLTPTNITDASSDLYQVQASLSKELFQLPGGPLQLGVGGSIYYEAVDSPSANPDDNGPTQRYFTINAFGTNGNRTVSSAYFELNAPILDQLTVNGSGRYDHYSSGQSNFSPKIGAKFTPFRQLAIRGTYSRGFRIPSFGEANALPTTGYVTQQLANIPQNVRAQYGPTCGLDPNDANFACPQYLSVYSIGLTTLASPNLDPEKSRSFTGGILFEPIRNISFTVDYYNIRKTGAITAPSSSPAINAYYAGQAIPAGYTVTADAPDVNNPTALPRIAFVASQLVNANTIKSEGIDFGANVVHDFGGFRLTSNLDASLILELSTTFPDGSKETYVDTLGNFNLTAGTGTFRWRGNWQNTFEAGPYSLTGTVNYTSGYDLSAQDQEGSTKNIGTDTAPVIVSTYRDHGLAPGYTGNRVKSYITVDLNGSVKVNDNFTFYVNVINLIDRLPPVDPVTYGAYLYNPVQAGNNILGRQFRAGAKFSF